MNFTNVLKHHYDYVFTRYFFDNYQTFACDHEDTSVILAKIARKETITSNFIEIKFYK